MMSPCQALRTIVLGPAIVFVAVVPDVMFVRVPPNPPR